MIHIPMLLVIRPTTNPHKDLREIHSQLGCCSVQLAANQAGEKNRRSCHTCSPNVAEINIKINFLYVAMNKTKREFIGSFTVINDRQEIRKIVVSQDIITHYSGNTRHSKNLHLDTIDGVEVYKTQDPDVFRLSDGTTLRRKGSRSQSE